MVDLAICLIPVPAPPKRLIQFKQVQMTRLSAGFLLGIYPIEYSVLQPHLAIGGGESRGKSDFTARQA